jgi:hypothetical protein
LNSQICANVIGINGIRCLSPRDISLRHAYIRTDTYCCALALDPFNKEEFAANFIYFGRHRFNRSYPFQTNCRCRVSLPHRARKYHSRGYDIQSGTWDQWIPTHDPHYRSPLEEEHTTGTDHKQHHHVPDTKEVVTKTINGVNIPTTIATTTTITTSSSNNFMSTVAWDELVEAAVFGDQLLAEIEGSTYDATIAIGELLHDTETEFTNQLHREADQIEAAIEAEIIEDLQAETSAVIDQFPMLHDHDCNNHDLELSV